MYTHTEREKEVEGEVYRGRERGRGRENERVRERERVGVTRHRLVCVLYVDHLSQDVEAELVNKGSVPCEIEGEREVM